jgi:phosphatidylglycerol---prolipoprotein diacylglyceryl transferase
MIKYLEFFEGIAPISSYNIFLGIGMIAFFLTLEKVVVEHSISNQILFQINSIIIFSFLFSVIGAIVLESIYQNGISKFRFSGFTFYGGLLSAILSFSIFCKFKKLNFLFLINVLAAPFTLAHGIGRIGCFLAGCCYGSPTNSPIGVIYPIDSIPYAEYGSKTLHPVQLYESILLFLLSFILFKCSFNLRGALYFTIYPMIRFFIEYFRGDNRGVLFDFVLSPSQQISLLLFFLCILIITIQSFEVKQKETLIIRETLRNDK